MSDQVNAPASYVDSYTPPADSSGSSTPPAAAAAPAAVSQKLEDQNIFHLLGVIDGTQEQRDNFLDELQQVIWEDFLDRDVQLLLTKDEYSQLSELLKKQVSPDMAQQEEVVAFLEKLVPDLEDIMLEKALELKADMTRERITGLKQLHAADAAKLEKINEAERLLNQEQWLAAADLMNSL